MAGGPTELAALRCARVLAFALLAFLGSASQFARPGEQPRDRGRSAARPEPAAPATPKDPYKDTYRDYRPDFLHLVSGRGWAVSEKRMRLSSEKGFFTLNLIHEDSRADALVAAARRKESEGKYRDALKMYQILIDKYPQALYRVSRYGVFVPVSQYCQRRILCFPTHHLDHYRTLYDPRAREAFDQARRKHSLIGLSEIVDNMLATSYGGRAILELGNAALDTGHYLAALERFTTIRNFFPPPELRTPDLGLKVAYCRKMLGLAPAAAEGAAPRADSARPENELTPGQLRRLEREVETARHEKPPFHSQTASAPHVTADDYTLFPPTKDPLATEHPVWRRPLPGARRDFYAYSQPVVSDNSVIHRHKNIVYSRSVLTGETRWVNDLGGRANWHRHLFYAQEDALVQDGLVFTVMRVGGPSLIALDEVTGQLKWAYGPMVAATEEQARLRFESAPAGGPMTVYAAYILDNIEGDTHTDTEYGVIAFESTTGRVRWRTPLCRLAPGKFAAGFAVRRRNRIRSWTSPPLYHQGTVYCCTNAGAVAAIESLSGRVKWLFRYPYYHGVHDSTRSFGRGHHYKYLDRPRSPMLWYSQRPLVVGEQLYLTPVDTAFLFCVDRRSGKVRWTHPRASRGVGYFLGPNAKGELVLVYTGRKKYHRPDGSTSGPPVYLLDPKNGKPVWTSPDIVRLTGHPVMSSLGIDLMYFCMGARPFLASDNQLYVPNFLHIGWPVFGHVQHLARVDLAARKVAARRIHYSGETLGFASRMLHDPEFRWHAPTELKALEDLPHKDDKVKGRIHWLKKVIADTVPVNEGRPFMSFSRITFRRYGVPFEFRLGPRSIEMLYDRAAVKAALAGRTGPAADFAKAELALDESRLDEAAARLKKCLATISSEDLDFRALIKQQLYRVHTRLARRAIRAVQPDHELENALGMARTASVLAEEIETLFALADAYERKGDRNGAARCLRSIARTYGHREYPVAPIVAGSIKTVHAAARDVMDRAGRFCHNPFYEREMARSLALLRNGLPLYFSTVSPLPKPLTVRAGELAAARLLQLQKRSKAFAADTEALARRELNGRSPAEQLYRLWEFPGTPTAQRILENLFRGAADTGAVAARRRMWRLADAARVCGLAVPEPYTARVSAPAPPSPDAAIGDLTGRRQDLAGREGINWLLLERRGDRSKHPHLAFIGGRVRKRLDNKFVLLWADLNKGELIHREENIRLKGTGQEPGFFEAFVTGGGGPPRGKNGGAGPPAEPGARRHNDIVVVHGLYDVLAYGIEDHRLRWRFRTPFDFEIEHAVMSGDLLILSSSTETLALYLPTDSANGEVAWQVKEKGDVYLAPYFSGDRLVSVRKMPFNVTVRYRATGKLIGRLQLPDLSLDDQHPLLENGPRALPAAHDGDRLVVTDGWYYIAVDTRRLRTLWKRLIDTNDPTRRPAMRFALKGNWLLVLKQDYDQKVLHMLSSRTGELLWRTDPKDPKSPRAMHSTLIRAPAAGPATAFGIAPHPGQGFYFVAIDCRTGRRRFQRPVVGYKAKPAVDLLPALYGPHAVARLHARQEFELLVFDLTNGTVVGRIRKKGVAPFGVHGRVSATVQHRRLLFLSKNDLSL